MKNDNCALNSYQERGKVAKEESFGRLKRKLSEIIAYPSALF